MLNKKNLSSFNLILIAKVCFLSLPPIWGFFLVLNYGVNLCFWDEWSYVFMFDSFRNGTLTIADLFRQHNEHRMFFPNLVTLVTGLLTDMNSKAFMFVSMCFLTIAYIFLVYYIKKIAKNTYHTMLLSIILGFILFHACQHENILWGFQTSWFMISAFVIISLILFESVISEKNSLKKLIFMFICGVIASFSSLHGLFIWLTLDAVFVIAAINRTFAKKELPVIIPIVFVQVICFILYFYSFSKVGTHPDFLQNGIKNAVRYYFCAVGQLFPRKFSLVAGFFIFALSFSLCVASLFNKKLFTKNIFPLGLIIFGNLFVASISVGRSGFGVEQAFSSRYTTNVLLIISGIIIFAYNSYISSKRFHKIIAASIFLIFSSLIIENPCLLGIYNDSKIGKLKDSIVLTQFEDLDLAAYPVFSIIAPESGYAGAHKILQKNHWNVYSLSAEKNMSVCAMHTAQLPLYQIINTDFPHGVEFQMSNDNTLILSGWSFYDDDDWDLYVKNDDNFFKAYKTHRGDAKETFRRKSDLLGFTALIRNSDVDKNYSLYFVNETRKEIYTVDDIPASLPDYPLDSVTPLFYIDSESAVSMRGWVFDKNDYCRVFLKVGDTLYKANLELRPDVKNAFSLQRNDLGFIFADVNIASEYKLFCANYTKKKLYILKEKSEKN